MANSYKNYILKPISDLLDDIGRSSQSIYINDYLKFIDAKCYVIEDYYIDKDYIIDYSNFYARSFDVEKKCTKRIHFFNENLTDDFIKNLIDTHDPAKYEYFKSAYLGFVIVRPIKDKYGNYFLGRVLLKTYPIKDKDECRFYLTQEYRVSFYGIPLTIQTLPFLPQDEAVGACATSACWVALHPLNNLFDTPKYSPYEITELSVTFPGEGRNFPLLD